MTNPYINPDMCEHSFTGDTCNFLSNTTSKCDGKQCIHCGICSTSVPGKKWLKTHPEAIPATNIKSEESKPIIPFTPDMCTALFKGADNKYDHFGFGYYIYTKTGTLERLVCYNHMLQYVNANKMYPGFYIVKSYEENYPPPKTIHINDTITVKPFYDKANETALSLLEPQKTEKSFYDAASLNALKENMVKPIECGYKFNYRFTNKLLKPGRSTVLERIRELVKVGEELIRQADDGNTPDNLREFDKLLKNLREEG